MTGYEDGSIDWVEFYRSHGIQRLRASGSKHTGLCCFHENTKTSAFWFTTENGLWKCEAGCGQGNPTQFLAKRLNISTGEADKILCELAGVKRAPVRPAMPTKPTHYTVEDYAADKHLDAALLREWGLTDAPNKKAVLIPYLPGQAVRKRNPPGSARRFTWVTAKVENVTCMVGEMSLYGLRRLAEWPADAALALVEGESDCHALWTLGIPALGVPGASSFQPKWCEALAGHRILIHDEGDAGATTFLERTVPMLVTAKLEVGVWSTPGGVKDPSKLYELEGEAALDLLSAAPSRAVPPSDDLSTPVAQRGTLLGTRGLKCPRGWACDERGVRRLDTRNEHAVLVTATPLVISRRVIDFDGTGERIELALLRDGAWHTFIAKRDTAFSAREVVGLLAPLGANVTSVNARDVVSWLGALEASNLGTIESVSASHSLGWCGTAFLPTNPDGVLLDVEAGCGELVAAFRRQGNADAWAQAMMPHRTANPIFRFVLAAGLAAPLLRALKVRNFFVYNWGDSKGGKTAALKAAISAWGDPDVLMTTFNATGVGLERLAGLMRDLPLAIDERQAAAADQKGLDESVYGLASGVGRVRGARDGGLQAIQHYRTIVLATGEEPLAGFASKTGVSTRVLELPGVPFVNEDEAAVMHRFVTEHHGHAGPMFIDRLRAEPPETITGLSDALLKKLTPFAAGHAKSHLSGIVKRPGFGVGSFIWTPRLSWRLPDCSGRVLEAA